MEVQDLRWDDSYNYIYYTDNGPWSVRFTAWYTAGLLHRHEGDDVANAKAALENILKCQMTENYESAWYGTFKLSPDEPYPTSDSPLYPPSIYGSYDPNWREFVGTQLVQVVEEFSELIGDDLVSRIEDALEIAAVGSMRRNGSYPEGDNLVTGYANPALMRAWYVGWIGHRRNNQTFIDFSDTQAGLILDLFKSTGSNVLSEYNAPTYYGMDVWALGGAIQYAPGNATITTNAKYILKELWKDIATHYNPYLGNLAGPYDRAYTRDITTHSAILSMYWWGIYGRQYGPQPLKGELDLIYDIAQGASLSLIMDTVSKYIPCEAAATLKAKGPWEGERFVERKVPESLSGDMSAYRIATSWISSPLMIGAEKVNETENRGNQFVPAIVHWAGDTSHTPYPYTTFFSLYPSASTVHAVAGPKSLTVSYPNTTQDGTDIFTFALSNVPPSWTLDKKHVITGFESLPCLDVTVNAPGLEKQDVVYGSQLRDHLFYNISYAVPAGFKGVPTVSLTFEYTC
ncbi:Beta-galactosidase [Pleurostoma richardsiae]|uniref:Beta-galactosidase n=1 Tax=Pleurostoma richardsiae TaxID=41990 RepID=A0AA38VLR9_9PEZI|nr:Beta-galactosidase [Pleurostoma richardsiae]